MTAHKRVLIVDDSRSLRRMIEDALQAAGLVVSSCGSGEEALQLARTERIDAIVTDLNMPGIDGLELARRLKADAACARCPILILTTDNSAQRKQEARLAGVSGWVLKPFQPETLVKAIDKVCQRAGGVA